MQYWNLIVFQVSKELFDVLRKATVGDKICHFLSCDSPIDSPSIISHQIKKKKRIYFKDINKIRYIY